MSVSKEKLNQLLDEANNLQQEEEVCSVCGEDYEHTDVTRGGGIVFVHGNATPSTADCCTYKGDSQSA